MSSTNNSNTYSVVVVGAGPAGLRCAQQLASHGVDVLVLERKPMVGPKVCAGGITWNGLINKIPAELAEKRFPSQHIVTRCQHATVSEDQPIIATVNRQRLGEHMAAEARRAGAEIRTSCQVTKISTHTITCIDKKRGSRQTIGYQSLIGADGSSSTVRRYLGLPMEHVGVGINYQIPGDFQSMEWHLQSKYFLNGYGWIFPHAATCSIGAYGDSAVVSPKSLKQGLLRWSGRQGFDLSAHRLSAEFVNFDYRGWKFGNIYLAGDAAGFASGLTGEGIYPAILSGEYIARHILTPDADTREFDQLIRRQRTHARLVKVTGKSRLLATMIAEAVTFALRTGMLHFGQLEMAHERN